ncbi:alpha/beta fold hydrolase [Natrialbaceae archaeon A-CW1-1]
MTRAENGDVQVAYEVAGPEDGDPVVCINGLGYGRWMWRWQRAALADTYRTILWDNRGTGDSDAPEGPYSIDDMAADLEAVLADAGIERAHIVGASMGGMIAQRYALEYDRAATLSLLCTTPGGRESTGIPEKTKQRLTSVPEDATDRESIRHRMEPAVSERFYAEQPDLVERIVDWRLESDADDAARQAQAAAVLGFDVADDLHGIDVPTLVLHGDDDRVVPVENGRLLAERLPNARLEECPAGAHLFFIEDAHWVNERLRGFLEANELESPTEAR